MPSAQTLEYIQKMAEPRTPEELVLALQNPYSPAYKAMINMIFARMVESIIVEKLIQQFLIEKYLATQEEKEAMLIMLAKSDAATQQAFAKQAFAKQAATQAHHLFEEMNHNDADALQSLFVKSTAHVVQLETQIHALDSRLGDLQLEEEENFITWENLRTMHINDVAADLQNNSIQVRDTAGEVLSDDEVNVALQQAFQLAPPAQLVRMVMSAAQAEHREEPELPHHLAHTQAIGAIVGFCRNIVGHHQVEKDHGVEEINWGSSILKAMRENKAAIKLLDKPLDVSPYEAQVNIEKERRVVNANKDKCNLEIKQERQLQNLLSKQFEKLTHMPIEAKAEHISPRNNHPRK